MFSARDHLRSAIACLVLGWLLVVQHTGLEHLWAYTLLVPAIPLWIGLRALDRGAYRQALWHAWASVAGCCAIAALWDMRTMPGLFCLVALLFSLMAAAQLRRL